MSDQTYNVKYNIEVESTEATRQLGNFTAAVEALSKFKGDMSGAVENVQKALKAIDKALRTDPSGKGRKYNYKFNVDTRRGEEKLGRIITALTTIEAKNKSIRLTVNPGKAFDSRGVQKNAAEIIRHSREVFRNLSGTTHTTQTTLTRSLGKINSALAHLERSRELNIQTDVAKGRLTEILALLGQVRTAAAAAMPLGRSAVQRAAKEKASRTPIATQAFLLPPHVQEQLQTVLPRTIPVSNGKESAAAQKRAAAEAERARKAADKALRQRNVEAVRSVMRQRTLADNISGSRQRAAINRLQYSHAPSLRNALPFAYMLNGYMLYGMMRRELTDAVEYANTMESARSILRVADSDLSSFERRFEAMARNVRQVGIDTKFTATEVGGAVKYLAMAGQSIESINQSIRPITNLALIGDNPLEQVADLTTNIMAGYDIASGSMPVVADIISSTISRSNVNIIETAESFKMAAGYLRMAGIDFTESAAAIGLLGNMGVKGTMAGTSLRALASRLAYQPKEARDILDRLGVKFTHEVDVYGRTLEKIRPLADIFEDLNAKGASLGDMHKIFGRIGGNAAIMFLQNYEQLRELTTHNRTSHGISSELAKVKQETTKGLWYQFTSTFSEMFMRGYEIMEPQIQRTLRKLTAVLNTEKFARGLASLSSALLDLFALFGKIAAWVGNNYRWLEPVLFTGFAATRLFRLAGAVTNLAVAFGLLGKQKAAMTGAGLLSSLTGLGGSGLLGRMTFADKRNIVGALRQAGVSGGRGALMSALAGAGVQRSLTGLGIRRAASGVFASQVVTGRGVLGAGAALGALGTGAVVAAGAIGVLAGALGWAAYKAWKVKEATDAAFAELQEERKYNYPSVDALYESLRKTYNAAVNAKGAVDKLTEGKSLQESTGLKVGAWTGNWFRALLSGLPSGGSSFGGYTFNTDIYTLSDAYRDDLTRAIVFQADKDGATRIKSVYAELGKLTSQAEIQAYIDAIPTVHGYDFKKVDKTLYSHYSDTSRVFRRGLEEMTVQQAAATWEYQKRMNEKFVPEALAVAREYKELMERREHAQSGIAAAGFSFGEFQKLGFRFNEKTQLWEQIPLAANATEEQKVEHLKNFRIAHEQLGTVMAALRETFQSGQIAENIFKRAGIPQYLYSNEPASLDETPWKAPGISVTGLGDDGGAGGNYSGTGKLSSAAPKQVIVNITNLLSIETVELLRSGDGSLPEIRDLKEQMAQALIDVVHDFDASWNGA
jgi:TP901 family phage tail tape measure protein